MDPTSLLLIGLGYGAGKGGLKLLNTVWDYYTGPELTKKQAQAEKDARLLTLEGKAEEELIKGDIQKMRAANKADLAAFKEEVDFRADVRIKNVERRRQKNIGNRSPLNQ
jgi:hypothetical protein